ncbi:hypothetical protein LEP1GSC016_3895 [Leptospira borgpetersenii serovar Hardjo-bovis str. Sponselee]|uniref:Uncharacterized protein n=1 Tax=Leptospira borgpetersenii serovar Hardjo-bovis str. Sponselee TaxID=1303729 RepID=M6BTL0_LEPBO|nr:hypothetical protein LEP1GSC016_3895 [Leptospira borgpetersenii serovar Hardjo-bovis str. Sponselee]
MSKGYFSSNFTAHPKSCGWTDSYIFILVVKKIGLDIF